jgi:hypothetical protein
MSCTLQQEEKLNELLDGIMDAGRQEEILGHLEECDPCRQTYQALQDLAQATAALPEKIALETDLWPGLRRQIEAEKRFAPRPMSRWGLALAAGLTAAAVLIGLQLGGGDAPSQPLVAVAPAASETAGVAQVTAASVDSLAGLRAAEAEFLRATETLLAELEAQRGSLPPTAVATVEENLTTIRSSIDEVWGALEIEPDSLQHASRLVGLYRTQMSLIQRTVKADIPRESL